MFAIYIFLGVIFCPMTMARMFVLTEVIDTPAFQLRGQVEGLDVQEEVGTPVTPKWPMPEPEYLPADPKQEDRVMQSMIMMRQKDAEQAEKSAKEAGTTSRLTAGRISIGSNVSDLVRVLRLEVDTAKCLSECANVLSCTTASRSGLQRCQTGGRVSNSDPCDLCYTTCDQLFKRRNRTVCEDNCDLPCQVACLAHLKPETDRPAAQVDTGLHMSGCTITWSSPPAAISHAVFILSVQDQNGMFYHVGTTMTHSLLLHIHLLAKTRRLAILVVDSHGLQGHGSIVHAGGAQNVTSLCDSAAPPAGVAVNLCADDLSESSAVVQEVSFALTVFLLLIAIGLIGVALRLWKEDASPVTTRSSLSKVKTISGENIMDAEHPQPVSEITQEPSKNCQLKTGLQAKIVTNICDIMPYDIYISRSVYV